MRATKNSDPLQMRLIKRILLFVPIILLGVVTLVIYVLSAFLWIFLGRRVTDYYGEVFF